MERWAYEPFPTLQPEVPPRPFLTFQAMMEGYPGESWEELYPLREAIADAFDILDGYETYVVDSSQRGLSVRAIGRELGRSKSSVFRARQRAYRKLAEHLATNPHVMDWLYYGR